LAADIRHTDWALIITEDSLASVLAGLDHGVPAAHIHNIDHPFYESLLSGIGAPASRPRCPAPGRSCCCCSAPGRPLRPRR
jgi:hypothetical protein